MQPELALFDDFEAATIAAAEDGAEAHALYVSESNGLVGRVLPNGIVVLNVEHPYITHYLEHGHCLDVVCALLLGAQAFDEAEREAFIEAISRLTKCAPCVCKERP